jgi:hypothetical protein
MRQGLPLTHFWDLQPNRFSLSASRLPHAFHSRDLLHSRRRAGRQTCSQTRRPAAASAAIASAPDPEGEEQRLELGMRVSPSEDPTEEEQG